MVPSVIVMVGIPLLQKTVIDGEPFEKDELRCVISTDGKSPMNYAVGYEYEMLTLFAWQMGKTVDISLGGPEYLDSLTTGNVDILVMPYADSLVYNQDYYASVPLADSCSWVIDGKQRVEHKEINLWLARFSLSEQQKTIVGRFTPAYEPYGRARSGRTYKTLSPYDDLIKKYASVLGWDRTMLTALIWQESQFHIEAHSKRGAVGLMQMMPRTAGRFEADDMLDPEGNIRAAVKYLRLLQNMFRGYADDDEELTKFTLAAYNAGEGRIMDCINYAASINAPHGRWEDIVAIIPDMREDSILEEDTVKLGKFQGYETINYVSKLESLSRTFAGLLN